MLRPDASALPLLLPPVPNALDAEPDGQPRSHSDVPSAKSAAAIAAQRQIEALLLPYADVLAATEPDGLRDKYILASVVRRPHTAREWVMCRENPCEGLLRFVHEEMEPVISDRVFAGVRKNLLAVERELGDDSPVVARHWFWAFMMLYHVSEGVQQFVHDSWVWRDPLGIRIHDCIKVFVKETVADFLQTPFHDDTVDDFFEACHLILYDAIGGAFNMRQALLGGVLKAVMHPISRNVLRKTREEMRQRVAEARAMKRSLLVAQTAAAEQMGIAADPPEELFDGGAGGGSDVGEEEQEGEYEDEAHEYGLPDYPDAYD